MEDAQHESNSTKAQRTQSEKTIVKRRLKGLISQNSKKIANYYVDQLQASHPALGEKNYVRGILNHMILDGLVREETIKTAKGTEIRVLSLPEYRIDGQLTTLRKLVTHKKNVHGLSYNAIYNRVVKQGLSPDKALSIEPQASYNLRAAIEKAERKTVDDEFIRKANAGTEWD